MCEYNTLEQNELLKAIENNNLDEVKRLLPLADLNNIYIEDGEQLMFYIIDRSDNDSLIFEYVAEKYPDLVNKDYSDDGPLLLQVIAHYPEYTKNTIEMILKYVEDINATDYDRNTALILVAKDIDSYNTEPNNPYELHTLTINLLLQYGADPWIKNRNDENAILLMIKTQMVDLLEVMLKAETPLKHYVGPDLLFHAVLKNNYDLIELLLKYSKDISQSNYESMLDLAIQMKSEPDIIELVRLYSATFPA